MKIDARDAEALRVAGRPGEGVDDVGEPRFARGFPDPLRRRSVARRGLVQAGRAAAAGGLRRRLDPTASDGRRVEVSVALEPLRELRGDTIIGLRLSRRVLEGGPGGADFTSAQLAQLSRSDRLRIDLGGIVQGFNLLREHVNGPRPWP